MRFDPFGNQQSERRPEVVVFGEINLDIAVRLRAHGGNLDAETTHEAAVQLATGGNTWNIARVLGVLGHSVHFLCTSARDDVSTWILRHEEALDSRVEVDWVPRLKTVAPRFVCVTASLDPYLTAIDISPQQRIDRTQSDWIVKWIGSIRSSHDAGLAIFASSIEPSLLGELIVTCKERQYTCVGAVSSTPTATAYIPHLKAIDLLVLNRDEATMLAKTLDIASAGNLEETLATLPVGVVLTSGLEGSCYMDPIGVMAPCVAADLEGRFVSALGAGDAYTAFLVSALAYGYSIGDPGVLEWATTGAAMVCQTDSHLLTKIEVGQAKQTFAQIVKRNGSRRHE